MANQAILGEIQISEKTRTLILERLAPTGPDQNIRPPFQENYAEASTSSEPTEDTQINLMGLNSEQQIFLTQEDQEVHILNKFQIQ